MMPCPVCHLPGGFHDRAVHAAIVVPVESLISGDRLDACVIEWARRDPLVAMAMDSYVARFERAMVGHAEPLPRGVLRIPYGGQP